MATVTPNFNWPVPTSTDLVKDGATAIEGLGDAIDASLLDLKGGTTGQILAKNSDTDMDFIWSTPNPGDITAVTAGTGISGGGTSGDVTITNSMATAIDAKGDLIAGTGADAFSRLAVGANNTILTADSTTATGLKWATPAPPASGLTLISVQTFSSSSGINVDNVFTSTYTNYRLVFSNITTSTSIYVSYRERAGGTNNATNYKKGQYYRSYVSGTGGTNSGGTEGNLFDLSTNTTDAMGATLELQCPATTTYTGYQWHASTSAELHIGAGVHANATAYDGFTLFPFSGTMSGTVSIYGYQKAV